MNRRNRAALFLRLALGLALPAGMAASVARAQSPLPPVAELMKQVTEHQAELDAVRENYTFTALQTIEDIDERGQVKKRETAEYEDFFVSGHLIERKVKYNGSPLEGSDRQKEDERVAKQVAKAEKTPRNKSIEGPSITVGRLLQIMGVRNERREMYRGEPTIVFDFIGRKDAKTHGMAEDASKKLEGTVWISEADRQVAHVEVRFKDNFRVMGGLVATVQKGSTFWLDQARVNGEIWLPTSSQGMFNARVLLFKNMRQRITEQDFDYKRFHVDTQQKPRDARAVPPK